MYSASAVDKATLFCFLDDQDTKGTQVHRKWSPCQKVRPKLDRWSESCRNRSVAGGLKRLRHLLLRRGKMQARLWSLTLISAGGNGGATDLIRAARVATVAQGRRGEER
jgi:hypothetical protein